MWECICNYVFMNSRSNIQYCSCIDSSGTSIILVDDAKLSLVIEY